MGLSPKSNYEKNFVSCFDIGEVPRSPGKRNWNWLYFLPFIFTFEQGEKSFASKTPFRSDTGKMDSCLNFLNSSGCSKFKQESLLQASH